jgi:RNA polymerase sigma factor (sigma-70 family)
VSPWLSDLFLGSQSDERLVNFARTGHDRAFVAIVERYQRQLLAIARRLAPEGRAEDVVQQTFLSAFAALQAGVRVEHLRGWLYQIVRHAAMKAAAPTLDEWELEDTAAAIVRTEEDAETRLLLHATLAEMAALPERQREALVGTAVHGRSRGEIAHSMGLTDGAVGQLIYRARATLRSAVTAITPYPLAQWFAGTRATPSGVQVAELLAGAGSASAAGVALKVGAVVVSAAVATGVVASNQGHQHTTARPRAVQSETTSNRPPPAKSAPLLAARAPTAGDAAPRGAGRGPADASRSVPTQISRPETGRPAVIAGGGASGRGSGSSSGTARSGSTDERGGAGPTSGGGGGSPGGTSPTSGEPVAGSPPPGGEPTGTTTTTSGDTSIDGHDGGTGTATTSTFSTE